MYTCYSIPLRLQNYLYIKLYKLEVITVINVSNSVVFKLLGCFVLTVKQYRLGCKRDFQLFLISWRSDLLLQEDKFPFPLPLMFLLAIFNLLLVSNFRRVRNTSRYMILLYTVQTILSGKKICNIVLTFIIKLTAKKDVVIMRKIYC